MNYQLRVEHRNAILLCASILAVLSFTSLMPIRAADVSWLEQVTIAPDEIPPADRGYFVPLLEDSQEKPIDDLKSWEKKRREIREAWYEFLGPMPKTRPKVELKTLHEDRDARCIRQLVEYECEPEQWVQGYLLLPTSEPSSKLPALVALHQTTHDTIEEIAGITGNPQQQLGLKLARRGFVVFCPRNFLWQDVENYDEAVARFKSRHLHTLGMHKMLFDAMRAVDVLLSLPQVDRERIGCVGHSLGGKEALYLAAFDDRIQATIASELGMGFSFTNWHAPWYLGPQIAEDDFQLNHHQLAGMIAPKPFLLLAGESGSGSVADGERSWPYLRAAQPIYELYDKPIRMGLYNHGQGHTISDETFDRLAEWLEVYLGR